MRESHQLLDSPTNMAIQFSFVFNEPKLHVDLVLI